MISNAPIPDPADVTHRLWAWDPTAGRWSILDYGGETRVRTQAAFRHRRAIDAQEWGTAFLVLGVDDPKPSNDILPIAVPDVLLVTQSTDERFTSPAPDSDYVVLFLWNPETAAWREIGRGTTEAMTAERERRFDAAHAHGMNEWAYTIRPAADGLPTTDPDEHQEVWIVETDRGSYPGFRSGVTATRPSYRTREYRAGDIQPLDVIAVEDNHAGLRWRLVLGVFTEHTPLDPQGGDVPPDVADGLTRAFARHDPTRTNGRRDPDGPDTTNLVVFYLSPDPDGNQLHAASWYDLVPAQEAVL